jgi:tetratricopeptide (TPR) repeat protein
MTIQDIQTIYGEIIHSLDRRALKTAFDSLANLIADSQACMFREELNGLRETYKQLLHYYTEGSKDPMQAKIYHDLTASAYEFADKIRHKLLVAESPELYYVVQRTSAHHPEELARLTGDVVSSYEINDPQLTHTALSLLFKHIWTTPFLSEDETEILYRILSAGPAPDRPAKNGCSVLNSQIVSSLMLGLQHVFDKRKMQLLIVAAASKDEEVKIRAYAGLLVTLFLYRFRTDCYPEIKHHLEVLAETPGFRKITCLIILRFILARETEKISNKIRDEIMPEMMKLNPKFNPRISLKDLSPDNPEEEMNPEWIDQLSRGKLGKQMEEFTRLQEEGADVMHSTFIHLKSFSFFNEISNWFIPFTRNLFALPDGDIILKSLEVITPTGFICNSDLYSLYFGISRLPEAGREMMLGQMKGQLSELKEQQIAALQTKENILERLAGQYIQDLYRFYKLHPRRMEFKDIFALPLDFHNLPILREYFSDKDDLLNIADHYLRKNHFDDARVIYERLSEEANDDMLYQKNGYCRQMSGDYDGAIASYEKAGLIRPESKWLLRHTAQCYRAIKKPEKAITYYLQCERLDPENLSLLLSIGSCYSELKNYAEALKYYFKVYYLGSDGNKAWRPIAWCSFLTGKYDQARHYYQKIISGKPDAQDYLNVGHIEWVMQNVKGAYEFYLKSIAALNGDYNLFRMNFDPDIPDLTAAGIVPEEIPLLLDQLRFATDN